MSAAIALTLASTSGLAGDAADARKICESLKGQLIGGARLVDTALVTPTSGAGVAHCSGGPGADIVDLLEPLDAWVEQGQRPSSSKLVARNMNAATGKVNASRPLCRYPAYPHYAGQGDVNSAESFVCKLPAD
jgi:hypothetical protein